MSLINFALLALLGLAVAAVVLWVVQQIPGDSVLKQIARAVVIGVACLLLLAGIAKLLGVRLPFHI